MENLEDRNIQRKRFQNMEFVWSFGNLELADIDEARVVNQLTMMLLEELVTLVCDTVEWYGRSGFANVYARRRRRRGSLGLHNRTASTSGHRRPIYTQRNNMMRHWKQERWNEERRCSVWRTSAVPCLVKSGQS